MTVVKTTRSERQDSNAPLMNEKIRYDKVQLIDAEGRNVGTVSREFALRSAREAGLDLVIIADQGREGVPIAKVMDYGKVSYEKKKQQAEAKKKQVVIQIKELKMRPKIGEHDFQTKINQALGFLQEGKRVKFTLMFRGREAAMKQERGAEIFSKIQQAFAEAGIPAHKLQQEGEAQTDMLWSRIYYTKK